MEHALALPIALRRLMLGIVLAVAAATVMPVRAEAQMIAAIVNGEPVTNYDVEQRSKLIQLSTHKTPSRQEVLQELIDEKLKLQLLRRFQIPDIDKDVENAYANMARRIRATPKQFTEQLARQGVKSETIKSRIKAELVWSQIIRGRFQASFQFSEKDIMARLRAKPDVAETVGYDYTLYPILFVVPHGSSHEAFDARRKEAEALRARFNNCQQDLPYVRALPFVAVRQPVVKSSAELPPALRELLEKTEIGRLTAPDITQQGVEVYALCSKKRSAAEDAPAKREIRSELYKEQFEKHSKRYLNELRSQAMIEYR